MLTHSLPILCLDPPERTLPVLLCRQAERYEDKPLIAVGDAQLSYREAPQVAGTMAAALSRAGIEAGDRVAAMCRNRIELLELVLGCVWLGAVAVPLNVAARGEQLRHMLVNSGARALMIDGALLERLNAFAPPPSLERIWVLDGAESAPERLGIDEAVPRPGVEEPCRSSVGPGDTALIVYTSGTTGPAKGVCIPHAQLYWWGVTVAELLELDTSDVLLNPMPLFHINALSIPLQALAVGATGVIVERFSASRYWDQVRASEATVGYLLGTMASILLSREVSEADRSHRMKVALIPGASAEATRLFQERFGIAVAQAYASTETNCAIGCRLDEQRPGWLGYARAGFEARVVDELDSPIRDGSPGELVLRHREPFAFAAGYFEMAERTLQAWRNLWFHTGDRVVRDPDGWFRFVDRLGDSIRRRGENISSFDVENAIAGHDAVEAVAVFAVPSELGEDDVMAAVVLKDGARVAPPELIEFCEARLARYAIPRYVDVVDSLPLTESGKVRKEVLRESGVTLTTWDREAEA